MNFLKRLLRYAGPLNAILGASILAGLAATFLQLGVLFGGYRVLMQPIAHWWLWLMVLALGGGVARFGEQYLGHLAAFKILSRLRNATYQKLLQLAPAKLDDQRSSDVLKLLAQDINQIEIFYAHTLAPVVIGGLTILILTITFFLVNPWLGLVALIAYGLLGIGMPLLSQRRLRQLAGQLNAQDVAEQRILAEAITGKATLQQYQAIDAQLARLDQASAAYWQINQQKTLSQTRSRVGMQVIVIGSVAVFGAVTLTQQLPVIWALLFPFTFGRMLDLGSLPGSLSGGLLAAKGVFDFLDEAPMVPDTGTRQVAQVTTFGLDQVTFAYPQRPNKRILEAVSLTSRPGERLGLIGPSGAGKSTIMKLVMRWYQADAGHVMVNGEAAENSSLDTLRRTMAYVPQTAQIFAGTIRENLTLRDATISDERLWEVLDWVHLTAPIQQLPAGLATPISATQPVLSAGEIQRLELVRALIRDSSLLILDEPTSNLDVVNEALILNAVQQHYLGTVVLVTHRRSSLALCDRILELRAGHLRPVADVTRP